MADTSIVTPSIGVGTNSLANPLITPGYPMAAVPKSSPLAGALPPVAPLPNTTATSVLRDLSLTQAGEIAKRVI